MKNNYLKLGKIIRNERENRSPDGRNCRAEKFEGTGNRGSESAPFGQKG